MLMYGDHNLMFTPFCGADDVDSMDDIFYGKPDDVASECVETLRPPEEEVDFPFLEAHAAQWHDGGKGLMSHKYISHCTLRFFVNAQHVAQWNRCRH